MKVNNNEVTVEDVQSVYNGAEGDLWILVMGEQVHIGGFISSNEMADKAGIKEGMCGLDLCCGRGAGMRFLVQVRKVAHMTGVDATYRMVDIGRHRCHEEQLTHHIDFLLGDSCNSGLPSDSVDFVWGEDAWCYVPDKPKLISEAVRLVKPGGVIAFTDWIQGSVDLSDEEAQRYLSFMEFPNILTINEYVDLLEQNDCEVLVAEDTQRFSPYMALYLDMVARQFTYDLLKILNFDMDLLRSMAEEFLFMQQLAHEGKIAQGMLVARKKDA